MLGSRVTGPVRTQVTALCAGSEKKSFAIRSVSGLWKSDTYSSTPFT